MFEIPEHIKRNSIIGHTNIVIKDNRLIWLGQPAVSNLMLECGGLQYPGVPVVGFLNNERKSMNPALHPVSGRAGAGHLRGSCRSYTTMTRGHAAARMVRTGELCRRSNQIRRLVRLL